MPHDEQKALTDIQEIIEAPTDDEVLYGLERVDEFIDDLFTQDQTSVAFESEEFDVLSDMQVHVEELHDLVDEYLLGADEGQRRKIIDDLYSQLTEVEQGSNMMAPDGAIEGPLPNLPGDDRALFMSVVHRYNSVSQYQLDGIERTTRSLSDLVGGLSMAEAAGIMAIVNMLKNWATGQRQQLAQDIAWELGRGNLPAGQDILRYRSPY